MLVDDPIAFCADSDSTLVFNKVMEKRVGNGAKCESSCSVSAAGVRRLRTTNTSGSVEFEYTITLTVDVATYNASTSDTLLSSLQDAAASTAVLAEDFTVTFVGVKAAKDEAVPEWLSSFEFQELSVPSHILVVDDQGQTEQLPVITSNSTTPSLTLPPDGSEEDRGSMKQPCAVLFSSLFILLTWFNMN